jgi:hypothetical protein
MMKRIDLAWAAGAWDGEGSTSLHMEDEGSRPFMQMGQKGKDRELLKRFQKIVGCGNISLCPSQKFGPYYKWGVYNESDCIKVQNLLWPYLCKPKQNQILKVMDFLEKENYG